MSNDVAVRAGARATVWADLVQLNVRVPREVRRRFHLLSRRDDLTADELLAKALELYEIEFGKAPEKQRGGKAGAGDR